MTEKLRGEIEMNLHKVKCIYKKWKNLLKSEKVLGKVGENLVKVKVESEQILRGRVDNDTTARRILFPQFPEVLSQKKTYHSW